MKIGIDAHAAERDGSGNCTYISNLLLALREIDEKNEYVLYATDKNHVFYDNFNGSRNFKIRQLPVHNPFFRIPFFLARQTYRDSLDILHVQYNAPPIHKGKLVTTIHDLGFLHIPETFSRSEALRLKILTRFSANHSETILTGSEYSKNDIIDTYGLNPQKVEVIPHGVSPSFGPKDPEKVREVLSRYKIEGEYFLSVGRLNPRKNLVSLVQAFRKIKERAVPHKLIFVGKKDFDTRLLIKSMDKYGGKDVVFTGFVPEKDLPYIYSGAAVFIYPSLFEGVGLPVLEAMKSGVPVVSSNTTSLKEIAADAALTVDPLDVDGISQAIFQLINNEELRATVIEKGFVRANEFSWEETAQKTQNIYKKVLEGHPL